MDLHKINLGLCMCGSFCTFEKTINEISILKQKYDINIVPILSEHSSEYDTRFGKAEEHMKTLIKITGNEPIDSITKAEPIGPLKMFDIMLVAPCTSNTMAKLANGITDNVVTMACKSHLRNNRALVIALATNDALGISLTNIGKLIIRKNIFFVPFGQDNPQKKPLSMVADMSLIEPTLISALDNEQIQPIII